jgi:hypothetical protein
MASGPSAQVFGRGETHKCRMHFTGTGFGVVLGREGA